MLEPVPRVVNLVDARYRPAPEPLVFVPLLVVLVSLLTLGPSGGFVAVLVLVLVPVRDETNRGARNLDLAPDRSLGSHQHRGQAQQHLTPVLARELRGFPLSLRSLGRGGSLGFSLGVRDGGLVHRPVVLVRLCHPDGVATDQLAHLIRVYGNPDVDVPTPLSTFPIVVLIHGVVVVTLETQPAVGAILGGVQLPLVRRSGWIVWCAFRGGPRPALIRELP